MTMLISSGIFWLIFLSAFIHGLIAKKKSAFGTNADKKSVLYGNLCAVSNLLAGFLLFELFSFIVAVSGVPIIINIVLHILAWYVSMYAAHRYFPRVINRIVELFVDADR